MTYTATMSGLPNPTSQAELYEDVPTKRFFAWIIDVVVIAVLTALVTPFTFFTALFFLPVLYAVLSFLYRWVTLTTGSATWGMRMVALEMRQSDGRPFTGSTAFLHTVGYVISVVTFPLQLISIALMLMSERKQGLSDMVLGTAAINRAAR
ncbi:MAG: RDD family protein [Silicimonas sp.]|nr:RDD family protein [Silicimonas sp.]